VSDDLRVLLAVGTRLAHDGRWWQVSELDGPHVLLSGAAGVQRVSAAHLLADPSTRLLDAPGDPVEGVGAELAGLGEAELAGLRERQLETTVGTALLRTRPDGRLTLTAYGELFARDVRPALESLTQSRSQSTSHAP
jgi:hypothetical protein